MIRPPAGDRRSGACACVCLARALAHSRTRMRGAGAAARSYRPTWHMYEPRHAPWLLKSRARCRSNREVKNVFFPYFSGVEYGPKYAHCFLAVAVFRVFRFAFPYSRVRRFCLKRFGLRGPCGGSMPCARATTTPPRPPPRRGRLPARSAVCSSSPLRPPTERTGNQARTTARAPAIEQGNSGNGGNGGGRRSGRINCH